VTVVSFVGLIQMLMENIGSDEVSGVAQIKVGSGHETIVLGVDGEGVVTLNLIEGHAPRCY
jgi:hypothetical protein